MTTHRLCRVTEMPDDLGTATVTAPLILAAELRWLAATSGHRPPGAGGSHLLLASGELLRHGNQRDSAGGRERR
jgi:hypothetical protein